MKALCCMSDLVGLSGTIFYMLSPIIKQNSATLLFSNWIYVAITIDIWGQIIGLDLGKLAIPPVKTQTVLKSNPVAHVSE